MTNDKGGKRFASYRPWIAVPAIFFLLVWNPIALAAEQSLNPRVDERTELLGIVFYLAGNPEYCFAVYPQYKQDVDKYFEKFKNHPTVSYARTLRVEKGVAQNAPMCMALDLAPAPQFTPPIIPFSDTIPEPRFGKKAAEIFAQRLRDFYHDSAFSTFFNEHKAFYEKEVQASRHLSKSFDANWHRSFFRSPVPNFHLLILMSNDGGGYSVHLNKTDVYAILTKNSNLSYIVHEFNHAMVNPLVDKHLRKLHNIDKLIKKVKPHAPEYATSEIVVYESIVRAIEVIYLKEHGIRTLAAESQRNSESLGFTWISKLVSFIEKNYRSNAKKHYSNFEDFMPRLSKFFEDEAR